MSILPLLALPFQAPLIEPAALAVLTIWQEARGEPWEGKVAVAEVIRDRTLRSYNSDGTLIGTLLGPYQFSGWNTADPQRVKALKAGAIVPFGAPSAALAECARAWNHALEQKSSFAHGALLYHANPMPKGMKNPSWASRLPKLIQIGAHAFYADPAAKPFPKGDQ